MPRRTGNSDLRQLCNYGRGIFSWATAEMNNYTLAKLVVLTIVLILAIVRLGVDHHSGCKANCPTDVSAQRR
jgi:hypothetical protein